MAVSLTVAERRRVVSVRAWLEAHASPVLHLCSAILGEEVSLNQLIAVMVVGLGLLLAVFTSHSNSAVCVLGIVLMAIGSIILKEEEAA